MVCVFQRQVTLDPDHPKTSYSTSTEVHRGATRVVETATGHPPGREALLGAIWSALSEQNGSSLSRDAEFYAVKKIDVMLSSLSLEETRREVFLSVGGYRAGGCTIEPEDHEGTYHWKWAVSVSAERLQQPGPGKRRRTA